MANVAVVLSGCGVYDGTEIHEAVITLLTLDRAGAQYVCAAPGIDQPEVTNHLTGSMAVGERRNVLVESARIARGQVVDLAQLDPAVVDAAIFPGGFGAARNLSTWAVKREECEVNPDVARFIHAMHDARKPLGFICIAPVIAARVLGSLRPVLTIGSDADTATAIERLGARHRSCAVHEIAVDREQRIVTTPAYMLARRISEAAQGIERLVTAVLELCHEQA
jgi:enhancing lycopene biosynthesis protein 2